MLISIFGFLLVVIIIVFIHEFGHYIAAKLCGVRVLEFSIGFGKPLWRFRDSRGVVWKFCILPLGGFVKMAGDQSIYSDHKGEEFNYLTDKEKKECFAFQPPLKKAFIAAAGPVANYLLAACIIFCIYMSYGKYIVSNEIGEVVENSPAMHSGLLKGDKIVAIDDTTIDSFDNIYNLVSLIPNTLIKVEIERKFSRKIINVLTGQKEIRDQDGKILGNVGVLGVISNKTQHIDLNFIEAVSYTMSDIKTISIMTFTTIKQILIGTRSVDELRGAFTIVSESGKSVRNGALNFITFLAMISINIGFVNLLPIPILDGGHIAYTIYELISGKKPNKKIASLLNKAGLIIVIFMFVISTSNDIKALLF